LQTTKLPAKLDVSIAEQSHPMASI